VHFQDLSYHGVRKRTWILPGASPFFSIDKEDPSSSYPDEGLYDVELTVQQGNDRLTVRKEDHIRVLDPVGNSAPIQENMENAPIKKGRIIPRDGIDGRRWTMTDRTGASGEHSLLLENYYANEDESFEFETRSIDASQESSIALSFKVAYRQEQESDRDELEVYASSDCGLSWSKRGTFGADEMKTGKPTSAYYKAEDEGNWKTLRIEQPLQFGYNVKGLRFRFRFISDGGNNVYIDDINVAHPDVLSIGEEEADPPELELHPNPASETVRFRVEGKGSFEYSLKDAAGRKLRKGRSSNGKGQEHRLPIDDLSSGLYFLHIQHEKGEESVRKLMVR
jgi:hypothetical protein